MKLLFADANYLPEHRHLNTVFYQIRKKWLTSSYEILCSNLHIPLHFHKCVNNQIYPKEVMWNGSKKYESNFTTLF